jgi:hypothetical protein
MPATDKLRAALSARYSIAREIGAGGMATVYLARDLKHDREVALKVLRADLSAVLGTERFLAEVRIAARLDHPHILTLIDSGEADGILFYVLPYVRGESLRAKLDRERQLSIGEAVSITSQVASALDYAHGQGVVHRDIKPENILLHEGEAVLADFGIALAVKEASGNRMTETGLSLGTPQYMSPEQATGDRNIDRRTDIYSLGAVFYEMIAGEPPVTGVSAQAMIAKLMTEKPVRLRVLRDSVTAEVDTAAARALAKVPADRFATAGEFARALSLSPRVDSDATGIPKRTIAIAAGVGAVLLGALVIFLGKGKASTAQPIAVLRDRTQVTSTGKVTAPTITADGKTIAYVVTTCGANGCRYGVEMQDIGGASSRRVFDGATAIYAVEISGDRRNLMLAGTIGGRYGSFLVPTLGGNPRYLGAGAAALWAGGDSLVLGPPEPKAARKFWIYISALDGVVRDSIPVDAAGTRVATVLSVPGSQWFIVDVVTGLAVRTLSVDRHGRIGGEIPSRKYSSSFGASADAVWAQTGSPGSQGTSIVRFPFDARSGAIAAKGDTVFTGLLAGMDVTDDGTALVTAEGSSEYTLWAVPFADALKGNFSDSARVFRTTAGVALGIARDGSYLVLSKTAPGSGSEREWAIVPFGEKTEIPLPGRHLLVTMIDSLTLEVADRVPSGTMYSRVERRTGKRSWMLTLPDSDALPVASLPDEGWAWVERDSKTVDVKARGQPQPRKYTADSWFSSLFQISASKDGKWIAFTGWSAPSEDSVGFAIMSLPDGKITRIAAFSGEGGSALWLDDGSLLLALRDTPESASFYLMKAGAAVKRIGAIPRTQTSLSVSRDLKRAVLITRDYKGDAWVSRVIRR